MSNVHKVQKFLILKNDFGVDTGELTPTLKIKRKIVNQKYEAEI
jgi:long-chain acyl-CoA synthetase